MIFKLLKFAQPFVMPLGISVILLLIALLLSWKRPWASRLFLLLGIAFLWICSSPFGARMLLGPLESRYPIPPESLRAGAVVVLAGTVDLARSTADRIELYDRPERIWEGTALVRRDRAPWLVLSGGSGDPLRPQIREVDFLAQMARQLGADPGKMILQGESRTTYEDAAYTVRLLRERGITTFFLVTSAYHMPRAVACFRKQGAEPIPYPVDFRTLPELATYNPYVPASHWLQLSTLALHEYMGMAAYWVQGQL